tara:strand:- start:7 stop:438 length:432 start_codon:yes stop_codon:yes gene_type:complete
MIAIKVKQQLLAPVKQVMQTLLAHQQLDRFFNAKFQLMKTENEGEIVGGKGAVRQVTMGKIVFKEQIISANDNHICYRIIGKGPVFDHQGDIYLTPDDLDNKTTQLDYVIQFNGPKWLPDFILLFLVERDIQKAMKKLAVYFI